ncbi:YodC family protein [Pararoseomonas sp. SCSIO 73927]|uniref:YodC family protein n=1 Tax=Pararoseomonas sp. SCSIO 73927 TaxID=3114537 RepID=UPI0038CFCA5D
MANAFKNGDVVQMKSGGPPMTIESSPGEYLPSRAENATKYKCVWFKGATRDQSEFAEHLLQVWTPPKT